MDLVTGFFDFLLGSFLLLSPMLLLGLFLSGLIHVFISREAILNWFRDESLKSVSTSAAIGVPMPLCSCSVVPVVAEMRRKGASRSSCMSFLITAPETGADSILVTNAFFGWIVAFVRPIISFITAVVAGIFCIGLIRDGREEARADDHDHDHDHEHGGHDHDHDHYAHESLLPDEDDCYVSPQQLKVSASNWIKRTALAASRWKSATWIKPEFYKESMAAREESAAASAERDAAGTAQPLDFRRIVRHIFRYGFVEIADDILFALLVGIALGAVLFLAIPSDLMDSEYARWWSYPIMVLVGIPLYICASASTPIAAALVAKGFSPGAGLIFLMTGPATNTGTIAIIVSQFGVRFASIYVGIVIAVTVVLGILIDILLIAAGLSITVNLEASDSPAILFIQWGGAIILIALIIWRFRAGALKSGYDDMLLNVRPVFRSWGRVWIRLTRGRAIRGVFSVRTPLGIGLAILILVAFLGTGFVSVPPDSVGYGRLLGKVVWRDKPPGLHYFAPRPFVQVDKWPIREVKSILSQDPHEYVSGDLNLVALTVNVQYRVMNPYKYHYATTTPELIIEDAVRDDLRSFVSARPLEDLLNVHRVALENHIGELFERSDHPQASVLDTVNLVKVNLLAVEPVAETVNAFRDVSSAQEDRERIIVNAQRYLAALTPQAHGNADYEVKQADGEAYRKVATARAEAHAIETVAAAVASAPGVLRNMLWREKLETALSGNPKIIVPNKESLDKVALWKRSADANETHHSGRE